jgi:hypothetical protein
MVDNVDKPSRPEHRARDTKLYLYDQGEDYEGWFIVPVYSNEQSYAVACFDPQGIQHPQWHNCDAIETALNSGKALIRQRLDFLAVSLSLPR